MSKTRKTRPLMVRVADKNDTGVEVTESHNHTKGPCALPASPRAQLKLTHDEVRNLNCHYDWAFVGVNLCGCPMCTDRWGKEANRKARRNESKTLIRNWEADN